MTQESPERRQDEYTPPDDVGRAEQATAEEKATCHDCNREWNGGGADAVARTHAARYDHRVTYTDRRVYDGAREDDNE